MQHLEEVKQEEVDTGDPDAKAHLERRPVGCVGMITPWNFPLLQSGAAL